MPPAAPWPQPVLTFLRRAGALAGAALSIAILFTLLNAPAPLPLVLPAFLAVAAFAGWRPADALLLLALTTPIARVAGRSWSAAAAWPEMLAVATIAGWFARRAFRDERDGSELGPPLAVAATVVAASLVVNTTLSQWRLTGTLVSDSWLTTYRLAYFLMESSGDAVDTAMRLLEALVLFRAAAGIAGRSRPWVGRLAVASVAAAAAAASVNVGAVWAASQASAPGVVSFARGLLTARATVHYPDPNAAGSYFVMMLAVAAGLTLVARARALTALAAVLITLGLWLSGSRTAIMAGFLAMLLPLLRPSRLRARGVRPVHVTVVAALLVAGALATAYLLPHRATQRSAGDATRVRYELALTAGRMLATAPVFGVGVGSFFNLSGEFVSPELLALFPPAQRENAHNYYLQILAELGLAGFGACAWLVWVAGRRVVRSLEDAEGVRLRWGLIIGIVAFALTCLGGHPLLIDDPTFTFALLAGALAGWPGPRVAAAGSSDGPTAAAGSQRSRIAATLVVVLLASIPVRWYSGRAAMDLSDVAFGMTGWYNGRDGVAYRLAGRTCLLYLPGDYRGVTIPLRATEPHGDVDVVFRVDGAVVEQRRIHTKSWQVVRLALPSPFSPPRFRRLELEVTTPALTPRVLFVGRITPF